jgi:hypothetical protein
LCLDEEGASERVNCVVPGPSARTCCVRRATVAATQRASQCFIHLLVQGPVPPTRLLRPDTQVTMFFRCAVSSPAV